MVNASNLSRVEESRRELESVLKNEKLDPSAPLLVLANVHESQAIDEDELVEHLKLGKLAGKRQWSVNVINVVQDSADDLRETFACLVTLFHSRAPKLARERFSTAQ